MNRQQAGVSAEQVKQALDEHRYAFGIHSAEGNVMTPIVHSHIGSCLCGWLTEVTDSERAYSQWLEHFLAALATAPPEQAASTPVSYPRPCGLCPGQIESEADLDWHGIGNCVPICHHCGGSGQEPTRFIIRDEES